MALSPGDPSDSMAREPNLRFQIMSKLGHNRLIASKLTSRIIEPPTRVVGQGLMGHCDQIVTTFFVGIIDMVDGVH